MGIALKVDAFGGMVPAIDDRLLPPNAAAYAENTYLYSGRLEGTFTPTLLYTFQNPASTTAFRIPNNYTDASHLSDATWIEFEDPDTDVLRTNVVEDTFDRYYWASSAEAPMYNTLSRIQNGSNALLLGVPAPSVAPTVTASGGSGSVMESRAYVYTWVTEFGEEGPPSPPTILDALENATWGITVSPAATTDTNGTNRLIAYTNIYRTVTGSDGSSTYFFVAQVPVATLSYSDTNSDTTVAANNPLQSTTWSGPPSDLQGWVAMPNGMIAAWDTDNNIWFCEPYRPHAWPVEYVISVQYPVVGMGVVGQTLIICTEGFPYWAYGVNPSVVSLSMIQANEPCLSRASVISAPEGVYYASPNGLVLCNQGVATNITRQLMLKDNWLSLTDVPTLRAARLGVAYYGWGSARVGVFDTNTFDNASFDQEDYTGAYQGVLIDPTDARVAVSILSNTDPTFDVMNDVWTGEVFVVRNGGIYWVNISNSDPTYDAYKWQSRIFQAPNKRNLEALKVYFEVPDTAPTLNPVPNTNLNQTFNPASQYGLVRLYADGELVMTRELRISGKQMRIPSGFKADYWQVEVEAVVPILSIQVAESAKELAKV